ncbi:hypothetical protein [Streptomyces lydicus]|uniref:hypothetical protein n=1 Tax=Streptomyces lydicus TaxID=47763 RepID=UPI001F50ED32|nr:hypothetical protein [Streptomyces lydicus]MCZ1011919.1 hypothetical protein [Streptomyces lydicus]
MLRWIRRRYWSHFIVGWIVMTAVITQRGSGPHLGLDALPVAVIASLAWALHSDNDLRLQIADGFHAQHQSWNSILRAPQPADPSPLYRAVVRQMESTERYLGAIARKHRLQRLTIALIDAWSRDAYADEAASLRQGRRAHIWLGSNWFGPETAEHLPVVLEHEVAHVLRCDNSRSTVAQAVGVLLTVLAAAWLPLSAAALTAGALWLLCIARSWWSELACDARAVRACGRDAVIALWMRNSALQRSAPRPARLWNGLLSASTHPPYCLRIWWAQRTRAPFTLAPHPLNMPPDVHGQAPTPVA